LPTPMTNDSPAIVHEARKRGDALAEIEVKFDEFMAFCSASVTASDHKILLAFTVRKCFGPVIDLVASRQASPVPSTIGPRKL
jgi:hypothetical protein